jgi:hypothetical protein
MRPGLLLAIALTVLLGGCVTPEEQRAADEAQCRAYGFKHRNDAFAECLQRLDLDRRATRRDAFERDAWIGPPIVYRRVVVRPSPAPKP